MSILVIPTLPTVSDLQKETEGYAVTQAHYEAALQGLAEITGSPVYGITKIPEHQPSQYRDNLLSALAWNLAHEKRKAVSQCEVYSHDEASLKRLDEADQAIQVATICVQETINALHSGLPAGYDLKKTMKQNIKDLENYLKTVESKQDTIKPV